MVDLAENVCKASSLKMLKKQQGGLAITESNPVIVVSEPMF